MGLDVRGLESSRATELFITATPGGRLSVREEGREIFGAIASVLRERGAWICQERVFAPAAAVDDLRQIRIAAYGDLDDLVEPAWLEAVGHGRGLGGVQVHAVRVPQKPRPLSVQGRPLGRTFEQNGCRWVVASGLSAPRTGDGPAEARATFEQAEALLKQAGADMRSVARTWIFIDDILSWYGPFNEARTSFFVERGVIVPGGTDECLPASTGIGVKPAGEAKCCMDLVAVVGPKGCVQRHHAAGKQRSAYEYGSAFARATQAKTPAGHTIYVSGTAAIDAGGLTCHAGDAGAQIQMTIGNVTAVLREVNSSVCDVVQAIAYCANEKVRGVFEKRWAGEVPWPWITVIGDICRADLLFEVEVTACPGSRKM